MTSSGGWHAGIGNLRAVTGLGFDVPKELIETLRHDGHEVKIGRGEDHNPTSVPDFNAPVCESDAKALPRPMQPESELYEQTLRASRDERVFDLLKHEISAVLRIITQPFVWID